MSSKKFILIACIVSLCGALLGYISTIPESSPVEVSAVQEEKIEKVSVRLVAVGDNLIHSPIYNSCRTEDGFDFDGVYEHVKGYISDADIAAINQETIFVEDVSRLSGYPTFGSPHQVGESTRKAGFNVVTHATNHTIDKGADSILYTMDFWDKYDDVTVLGINRSAEEQQSVKVWEKDDLKLAMLNFTYGLNGFRLPADKPYLVNLFERSAENAELINKAEESADLTVVFIHFGTEYTHTPTTEQKKDVEFLCENGADIIIGTHPHVVQPVTKHVSENGNEAVVFYSLGNFVSNQDSTSKLLGAMADVTITKENGKVTIEDYKMHPLVTHKENSKFSVYMLSDYTDDLAKKNSRVSGLSVEKLNNLYNEIIDIEVY
jgi:poly-gamma-glutamate synthesis protein (capsule biosynthesis protein)